MKSVNISLLRKGGVFYSSFGDKYMPIVLVNRAYANTMRALGNDPIECRCRIGSKSPTNRIRVERYYGSHDYNAGRHATANSPHMAYCPMWEPPSSGHLHSWRRGFSDKRPLRKTTNKIYL